jgi:hypothetical protein
MGACTPKQVVGIGATVRIGATVNVHTDSTKKARVHADCAVALHSCRHTCVQQTGVSRWMSAAAACPRHATWIVGLRLVDKGEDGCKQQCYTAFLTMTVELRTHQ